MKDKRPINLDTAQILAVNNSFIARASILHRASGLVLFLLIPVMLLILSCSLASPEGFDSVFDNFFVRFLAACFVAGTAYHFIMGVKHLMADMGMNEELESGTNAAKYSLVIAVVAIIASFIWVLF